MCNSAYWITIYVLSSSYPSDLLGLTRTKASGTMLALTDEAFSEPYTEGSK